MKKRTWYCMGGGTVGTSWIHTKIEVEAVKQPKCPSCGMAMVYPGYYQDLKRKGKGRK